MIFAVLALFFFFPLSAADLTASFDSSDGTSSFSVKNSISDKVFSIDDSGNIVIRGGLRVNSAGLKCLTSETLIIDGSLGIGTTSPAEKLDVSGNIFFGINSRSEITQWNPGSDADLLTNGTTSGGLIKSPSGKNLSLTIQNDDLNDSFSVLTDSNFDGTLDLNAFYIRSNGRIGINMTSPAFELDVNGRTRGRGSEFGVCGKNSTTGSSGFLGYGDFGVYGLAPDKTDMNYIGGHFFVGTSEPYATRTSAAYKFTSETHFGIYSTVRNDSSARGAQLQMYNYDLSQYAAVAYLTHLSGANCYAAFLRADYVPDSYGCYSSGNTYDFYAGGPGGNFGPFTGGHDVILHSSVSDDIKPGMLMVTTGKIKTSKENCSVSAAEVKLSDFPESPEIFGVFVSFTRNPPSSLNSNSENLRCGVVNALGEGLVWVCDINGNPEKGDFITSSSVPGFGMRQNSSQLCSFTLGKLTESFDEKSDFASVNSSGIIFYRDGSQLKSQKGAVYSLEKHGQLYRCRLMSCTYHSG